MSEKEEKYLGEEQISDLLTDMLSRIDNVIADTQLELGTDLPLHLWRMFQFGSMEQVIRSTDLEQEAVDWFINHLFSEVNPVPVRKSIEDLREDRLIKPVVH